MREIPSGGPVGFEVNSSFIGEFKSGDNIVYNLAILQTLYDAYDTTAPERRVLLTKPIVFQIACAVEAVLVDLALRILQHTREGVSGLPHSKLAKVRKKVEKSKEHLGFRRVISIFAESNVFDEDPAFYARLWSCLRCDTGCTSATASTWSTSTRATSSSTPPRLPLRSSAKSWSRSVLRR
jgi:hypothetical protein